MFINDFLAIMEKVARFKTKLNREGIVGHQRDIILKIYINDLTTRIRTELLEAI